MLSGFIWNSRGTGDVVKKSYISDNATEHKFDFIGIQETVRQDYTVDFLRQISGSQEYCWEGIPARGRSGGILVGINKDTYDVVETSSGVYFIKMLITSKRDNFTWELVVVYGDAQQIGRAHV